MFELMREEPLLTLPQPDHVGIAGLTPLSELDSSLLMNSPRQHHLMNAVDVAELEQHGQAQSGLSHRSQVNPHGRTIGRVTSSRSHRPVPLDILTGFSADDPMVTQTLSDTSHINQTIRERLDWSDDFNPTRTYRFKDDYVLQSGTSGRIQLDMTSTEFDTYLQVINPSTGAVIDFNDDGGAGTNSRLIFNVQAGAQYIVRATSYASFETGNYFLHANPVSTTPPRPPAPSPSEFNSIYGYGLINAAAAVAQAINQSTFSPVSDYGHSWNNNMVNAPEVWNRGYTGQDVVVAVVDTGVDFTHADLDGNIWRNADEIVGNGIDDDGNGYVDDVLGWDFVGHDNNPMDTNGHGTHVAGTIAAEHDGVGITGVAYNAQIMPVRVLGSSGSGSNLGVADGIRYAADNGADVINLSLGSNSYNSSIEAAVRYATEQGSIVVMAAGNNGYSQPGYPARFATQWGLSVGAVDRSRRIASFSNRAGWDSRLQHVVAPGVGIESILPGNDYASISGTSMAVPHVAGVVALMLSANPNLTHDQIRQIITGSTTQPGVASTLIQEVETVESDERLPVPLDADSNADRLKEEWITPVASRVC